MVKTQAVKTTSIEFEEAGMASRIYK